MIGKLSGWDETIVALATPPGIGALGIIRLSGKKSIDIINALFPSKDISLQPAHSLHIGYLKNNDIVLDEVVVSIFKKPNSYTGEDVIEISCHGSPHIHWQVIDACIERGARLAKAGEFTQRAFLNGRMDLAQAEAVADLIASNTEASRRTALHAMRGGFSKVLKDLRDQLLQFSALIELELDFSQEDVEFADRSRLNKLVTDAQSTTGKLVASFQLGNVIRNGVQVAIIGKPNAGKSTLLNALLNDARAIVSDIAGTTRDTIEEILNIDGILFRLIDTAGIRDHSTDVIEQFGMEKSLEKMRQAEVVIYLFDVNELNATQLKTIVSDFNQQQVPYLLVGNKTDTTGEIQAREKFSVIAGILFISARDGTHLDLLKEQLVDRVMQGHVHAEDTVITNARHYHALREVAKSLDDIKDGLDHQIASDLIALDIRRCLQYLGEITGEITNEDQLEYIFSKFCIGK